MKILAQLTLAQLPGRMLAWPANHGIAKRWGREVVIPVCDAAYKEHRRPTSHPIDGMQPQLVQLIRTTDEFGTWKLEEPFARHPYAKFPEPWTWGSRSPTGLPSVDTCSDFCQPDTLLVIAYESPRGGGSALRVSCDKGKTWCATAPVLVPGLVAGEICGRTDYIRHNDGTYLFLLTACKANTWDGFGRGLEGRTIAVNYKPSEHMWSEPVQVAPDPINGYSIMPSTVELQSRQLLTVLRVVDRNMGRAWLQICRGVADGSHWTQVAHIYMPQGDGESPESSPGSLVQLSDGRLYLSFAERARKRMVATISSDEGNTWSEPETLREGACSWDFGYPRSVELSDGRVMTAYYWRDRLDQEHWIEGIICQP